MSARIKATEPIEAVLEADADAIPGSPARPVAGEPFQSVLNRAIGRRALLKGAGMTGAALVLAPTLPRAALADDPRLNDPNDPGSRLQFKPVEAGNNADVVVPPDYEYGIIVRWGDPLFPEAPAFDVNHQTPEAQAQQFGFNADLVLFYPVLQLFYRVVAIHRALPPLASRALGIVFPSAAKHFTRRALLVVNHEYTTGEDMFPGYVGDTPTETQVKTEIEAHGISIIGIALQDDGRWTFDLHAPFNRRITGSTPIEITGPLRGHERMKTSADPNGVEVLGCLNNCAGGKTLWGTVLSCEENFDQYFANFDQVAEEDKRFSRRIPAPGGESERRWERFDERFDLAKNPNEYNRFGFVVEIDPYDPSFKPKKRTALGRFKHEGAACTLTRDGRVAAYMGDDARFEYVYKFVTKRRYNRYDRAANLDLLDEGTLYVARFEVGEAAGDEMGIGEWLPLVWEPGNQLHQAGYQSQAEVLLDTRGAADILGATPMDRPEDIEVNPKTGKVYIAMTNNSRRKEPNEANPRAPNPHGHIVEIIEDNDDPASLTFRWNVFIKCGDPAQNHDARFGDLVGQAAMAAGVSPISDPDNLVFDSDGNLWIATDGQFFSGQEGFGQNDGVFAVPVEGKDRGVLRQFLSAVPGCEVCGPEFSGDNLSFFCALQHPHEGNAFNEVWPIGDPDGVSKPAVIWVRHNHRATKIGG